MNYLNYLKEISVKTDTPFQECPEEHTFKFFRTDNIEWFKKVLKINDLPFITEYVEDLNLTIFKLGL